MGVTIRQIAEAAGVSRGTVDRALNNRGRIRPEVAERVRQIAEEMGYKPNQLGRALSMSRNNIKIGVILQGAETPFMKEVMKGVEEARAEVDNLGGTVLIHTIEHQSAEDVLFAMEKMRQEEVSGIAMVPLEAEEVKKEIDRFVEENPDFSYRGAKGIVALTGYNGILGYRTDESYETRPADLDENKVQWLDAHPDFSLEKEREGAKKVADAMKAEGWEFASHTWGHQNVGQISLEKLQEDTEKFKKNVDPLIGGTDIIIFAFGTDITTEPEYSGDKFEYLKGQGYNYFCNVDSSQYYVQIRDRYFRQGRRNLDGYRMYYNPELLEDLFNAKDVFDPARPTPVPPMG